MSTLTAQPRVPSTKGQIHSVRNEGGVPAVVYGLKKEPVTIQVNAGELNKFLALGNFNQVIDLDIDGTIEKVLLKEYIKDSVKDHLILHVDFLRVDNSHPVTVKIPVKYHGVPVGVKTEGGQFSFLKKFVKVKCKIQDIPEAFENDISELHSGTMVYVRDVKFDKGTILTPAKTALYGISAKRGKEEIAEDKPAAEAPKAEEAAVEEAKAE